jgi:hypothetical protein
MKREKKRAKEAAARLEYAKLNPYQHITVQPTVFKSDQLAQNKVKVPARPKVDSGLSRILDDPRVNTGKHRTILVENSIGYGHRVKP